MQMMKFPRFFMAAAMAFTPAIAGNKLIVAGVPVQVAKSSLAITPASEWNKLGLRPGTNGEIWTLDGDSLNKVTFYGGIAPGATVFREVDKKNRPLPRFTDVMLSTDIPVLLENSYRIALGSAIFTVDAMVPAKLAGADGIKFTYSFIRQGEEIRRKGEARAAIVKGKLYMITYEAPALYFFDKSLEAFHQIANSATF
jgi:hypothetical protein